MQRLYQQTVWPIPLIQRARATIDSLVVHFRSLLRAVEGVPIGSATLPVPVTLEATVRNSGTGDFGALNENYRALYGSVPPATDADELARNLMDIDDALTLNTMKTLKASDQISDLVRRSADEIEDAARSAAPGSAPFLTAAGLAASIQSQAMTQKMLAAMISQEAARIAHDNAIRKQRGIVLIRVRQGVSDLLER
jgi:hypothetical protein